ncbi:MAG: prephenate dehydrogenase [Spirochaetales bacterium]|nr:prephenate dehydrogenase [Spirochaetales bacterium]
MLVGVYGLGRFGAFWADCLSARHTVLGYSRNPKRKTGPSVTRVDEATVLECDVLFLCVAISALEDVLLRIRRRISADSVVIDTCSVKVYPIRLMDSILPPSVSLIGTHPMFGPDSGKSGIDGLPLVFCPVRTPEETAAFWRSEFGNMGLDVRDIGPHDHDREAAYTQGITHFMGRVLDDLRLEPSAIGTLGYHKLLEIIEQTCNDPFQLFLDLQRYNPYTGEMREKLEQSIKKMQEQLGAGSEQSWLDRPISGS